MAEPRLAAGVWIGALLRRVSAAGDFATVLHKGDAVAGSIVIIHRDRAGLTRALQRILGEKGEYRWRTAATGESVDEWVQRQRRYDPDLWIIELDTADAARFVDEWIAPG